MSDHQHPANVAHFDQATFGQRAADAVAGFMGSWRFIWIQSAIVALWVSLNTVGFVQHWDVYPFVLLNLVFSTQSAYASPLILLAQNRSSEHDRMQAEADYQTNQEALEILRRLDKLQDTIDHA